MMTLPTIVITMAKSDYDVVVMGTGLKECILGGMLAHEGKRVRFPPACWARGRAGQVIRLGAGGQV